MRFTPLTENEIAEAGLFEPGVYPCEVISGEDKTSKAGNEMIHLVVKVFGSDGRETLVNDYLLESIMFKLRHAAEHFGLMQRYERGELAGTDFTGKSGYVKIKIDPAKDSYAAKNHVADYVAAPTREYAPAPRKAAPQPAMADLDDEIPF